MTSASVSVGSGALHALAKRDVQRICSGQAVVDLATAVKELVENALDAGATLVDVKLRDCGLASVEVSDDGSGVSPANFPVLARKHHTSKICSFEDIESVASFGFRAEEIGTLLEFDMAGDLVRQTPKARPVGTTVIIEELFKPLAVRHKDFHRNIKKHYAKLLKVLQAYAVSSTNVKICVSNATGKNGTRQIVLSTQAHQSMGDNIASVFGTKFMRTLLAVEIDLAEACERIRAKHQAQARPTADSQDDSIDGVGGDKNDEDDDAMSASQLEKTRRVVGYVSKVGAGVGRSDNDRQFFFINGRPFDLPKVAKALNEVWRQFEMKQKPACVLNFLLPLGEYDVNVTPDKRETFLKHEAEVIEAFKLQLNKLYEPSRGTFTVQPLLSTFARAAKPTDRNDNEEEDDVKPATPVKRPPILSSPTTALPDAAATSQESARSSDGNSEPTMFAGEHSLIRPQAVIVEVLSPKKRSLSTSPRARADERLQSALDGGAAVSDATRASSSAGSPCCASSGHDAHTAAAGASAPTEVVVVQQPRPKKPRVYVDSGGAAGPSDALRDSMRSTEWSLAAMRKQRAQFFADEVADERERSARQSRLKVPATCSAGGDDAGESLDPAVANAIAAAALQRVLKKDDFTRMQVLGQFNLGFVIAKLGDDLFIVDQHASDEKFNFETLQQTTVLHQQPLVRPLPLELTAGEEMVVADHLDVFAKNGFTIRVDTAAPATKKLQLLSLPFTKHTQFGVEDIRELASLLLDAPLNAASIRLPKVMAMFASRACRSSIMIGTALHKEEMQKIVRNLSGLEQPWNCPHGRPTLRHLLDLRQLEDQS
ncbi:hypothetical protein PybrP1_005217 [[Pythium] brassicae (nom. inval.)]|nr:hypothetical protein PybrP1_005217 [[Pythium] brassicae (nom. inval.)]